MKTLRSLAWIVAAAAVVGIAACSTEPAGPAGPAYSDGIILQPADTSGGGHDQNSMPTEPDTTGRSGGGIGSGN